MQLLRCVLVNFDEVIVKHSLHGLLLISETLYTRRKRSDCTAVDLTMSSDVVNTAISLSTALVVVLARLRCRYRIPAQSV